MPDPLASLAIQKDLRAVVTACAGAIGRAIADALIANGARVLVSDVDLRSIKNSR
jgi:NAD(P)-dependent dehydrogenase (short-subunit alcohol dehydrogenase family)